MRGNASWREVGGLRHVGRMKVRRHDAVDMGGSGRQLDMNWAAVF